MVGRGKAEVENRLNSSTGGPRRAVNILVSRPRPEHGAERLLLSDPPKLQPFNSMVAVTVAVAAAAAAAGSGLSPDASGGVSPLCTARQCTLYNLSPLIRPRRCCTRSAAAMVS